MLENRNKPNFIYLFHFIFGIKEKRIKSLFNHKKY